MTFFLYSLGPLIGISIWSEPQILICWSNASHLSCVRFLAHRTKVSNRVLFARILRTSSFLSAAAILNGYPLPRIRRGAVCRQPKRRLPPAGTSNRICAAECSTYIRTLLLSYNGKIVTQSDQSTYFVWYVYFIHHPIGTWCIFYFKSASMLLFLSGSPKRAHFCMGNFLGLSKR